MHRKNPKKKTTGGKGCRLKTPISLTAAIF